MNIKKNSLAVFTVCNIAYLPRALVLSESLFKYDGLPLHIVIFDKKQPLELSNDQIIVSWVEDLGVENYKELAFKYEIIEFSTSLKPHITLRLLESHNKVIFLDPDTCLFSSLNEIERDLNIHPVILTPHHCTPEPSTDFESDLPMMRFGSFNLGFFGVNGSKAALDFLRWWSDRCIRYSFMESQFGLSTDQKWVTIAPALFRGIYISFNLGYNVAAWNTYERQIFKNDDGNYIVKGKVSEEVYPLIFFHFSNFKFDDVDYINKRASNETGIVYPNIRELGDFYKGRLEAMSTLVKKVPYHYDYMTDGSFISPSLRRAYAAVVKELPYVHDPFDSNGVVGEFARKNFLICNGINSYTYPTRKSAQASKIYFTIIYLFMRVFLRLAGPNRFYDLSRLFVYLSSYRQNRGLWKL